MTPQTERIPLLPDLEAADRHLTLLCDGEDDPVFTFQTFDDDKAR